MRDEVGSVAFDTCGIKHREKGPDLCDVRKAVDKWFEQEKCPVEIDDQTSWVGSPSACIESPHHWLHERALPCRRQPIDSDVQRGRSRMGTPYMIGRAAAPPVTQTAN